MTVHRIMLPEQIGSRKRRLILWDDKAGSVAGDHSLIEYIQEIFDAPKPMDIGGGGPYWTIRDPAHNLTDFKIVLRVLFWPAVDKPLANSLPKALREAKIPPPDSPVGCSVIFPDGTRDRRPVFIDGVDEAIETGAINLSSRSFGNTWLTDDGREVVLGVY